MPVRSLLEKGTFLLNVMASSNYKNDPVLSTWTCSLLCHVMECLSFYDVVFQNKPKPKNSYPSSLQKIVDTSNIHCGQMKEILGVVLRVVRDEQNRQNSHFWEFLRSCMIIYFRMTVYYSFDIKTLSCLSSSSSSCSSSSISSLSSLSSSSSSDDHWCDEVRDEDRERVVSSQELEWIHSSVSGIDFMNRFMQDWKKKWKH